MSQHAADYYRNWRVLNREKVRQYEAERRKKRQYETKSNAPNCKTADFGRERTKPKFRFGVWAHAHSGYTRNGIACLGYSL